MELRIFICTLAGAMVLRFAPGLLLRLLLAMPRQRVAHAIRALHSVSAVFQFQFERAAEEPLPLSFKTLPIKALLISTSLLALAALVTTALLEWHPAGLMLLLR